VPFRHSTDRRPVSIARIVQRRAAVQNAFRCAVEQNRWDEPPVVRGVKGLPHQRQCGFEPAPDVVFDGSAATLTMPQSASLPVPSIGDELVESNGSLEGLLM